MPINFRWSSDRLRSLCERELALTLDPATAVIFHNRKKDTLVLYTLDESGDRCITLLLPRTAMAFSAVASARNGLRGRLISRTKP
jgi:hypothetical protein